MTKTATKSISIAEQKHQQAIIVHGARTHNLKDITVAFPRRKLIVVTGVSGSGKSSLTMDTLFAEGQRRYAESLSSYARQFLMRMDKPDVDYIEGISPAIAIEQKVTTRSPRSTVGSMTELQDYLRLLFARIGITYSPISGEIVTKDEVSDVVDEIKSLQQESKVLIMIPFQTLSGRTMNEELSILMQKGFSRLYLNKNMEYDANNIIRMEDVIDEEEQEWTVEKLEKMIKAKDKNLYVLIDRIVTKNEYEEDELHRISDSVQTAYYESNGTCVLGIIEEANISLNIFNNKFERDGIVFEEPTPNFFSFNNPYGACDTCEGFGQILGIDYDLVIPDKRLSIFEGAVLPWKGEKMGKWLQQFILKESINGFPIHKPLKDVSESNQDTLYAWIDDFFQMVSENLYKIQYRVLQARYRGRTVCPDCQGSRLRKDALYVKVAEKNIGELSNMPIKDLQKWFEELEISEHHQQVASRILLEIHQRLKTLMGVGLNYLTLNRLANSLSGGESQRIQLTRFLGSNLTDSLYILDEPSIGLHPRDTQKLINVLKNLRDLDNTVIVVEHDEMMMQESDYIIDMGPLAAHLGGEVVATGDLKAIKKNKESLTGRYLNGVLKIETPKHKKSISKNPKKITIAGCTQNNLKDITVSFPLNQLVVVTGVSGSGKTTLVKQTFYPALMRHYALGTEKPGKYQDLCGDLKSINLVELIDQNPIGKSSRSNPVTYIKAYDDIRSLMAAQKSAKMNGLQSKHFSFNVDGGRCDTCKGEGEVIVEMQFLADVHLLCESCNGKRFKEEVLEVTYRTKNIYDILEMSVDEAIAFFQDEKNLAAKLQTLSDVGLGYIKMGQSSNTLSGGEAQRVKLASYLGKGNTKEKILFLFDEPTTGLHFHDINKLLKSFYALIEMGHSIIVIEHNTDVIKNADWIIDIGPEGGEEGGQLLYEGIPEGLKKVKESWTGKFI